MKRIISAVIGVLLILELSVLSMAQPAEEIKESFIYINPLYEDIVTSEEIQKNVSREEDEYLINSVGQEYVETYEEAAEILRPQLIQRKQSAVVYFKAPSISKSDVIAIFEKAVEHNGDPEAGDSLKWSHGGYSCSVGKRDYGSYVEVRLTYNVLYYTTAAQEAELTYEVDRVLDSLDIEGKDDYQKVCAIYDYICDNITYDFDNLHDEEYLLKYTAYAAAINKTAVCQGYALLFYRLALEEGIDARLIAGTGNNEAHGWNIVKMGDYYYNLDSTWDAVMAEYSYFLLNEKNFTENGTNHLRYDEYNTVMFHEQYPIGESDYVYDPNDFKEESAKGDLNSDGEIDIEDAFMARLIAAKLVVPTEDQKLAGDVDGDGRITASDANYIRRYVVGIISGFPA